MTLTEQRGRRAADAPEVRVGAYVTDGKRLFEVVAVRRSSGAAALLDCAGELPPTVEAALAKSRWCALGELRRRYRLVRP